MTTNNEDLVAKLHNAANACHDEPGWMWACELFSLAADRLAVLSAPQEGDAREYLHAKCDCVPDLGPAHCHLCGNEQGSPVPWPECSAVLAAIPALSRSEEGGVAAAYYEKNLARSIESNRRKQGKTLSKALKRGAPWASEDYETLRREDLSLEQKAEILGRTYFAVERRHADMLRAALPVGGENDER